MNTADPGAGTTADRARVTWSWAALGTEPGAAAVVWGAWAALLLAALACVALHGRNVPLAEDWHLVAPLTGHEPDLPAWLWAQNNEHRTPLPRLALLLVLRAAGGDFRAGMVVNVLVLAALAAVMVRAARALRGGRSSYADAFFPVLLLHLGNWPNLLWGWQLQFVLSTALHLVALLVILTGAGRLEGGRAALAAGCVALLPLAGASSLAFVPPLALWLLWHARLDRRAPAGMPGARRAGALLLGGAVTALALTGLYFVGYERATWNPPSPGLRASIETSGAFLALALGPAARLLRGAGALIVVGALLSGTAVALARASRGSQPERIRALGLVLFGGGVVALALAVGWGRAGLVEAAGMPMRYALLAAPALCCAYFTWLLYGGPLARRLVPLGLCALMLVLLPANTSRGLGWGAWYRGGMAAVQQDVDAGVEAPVLAARHRAFLLHWDQAKLEAGLRMMQEAGLGPFARRGKERGHD